jgi:uncharacterized RmlC-like cupin family protein
MAKQAKIVSFGELKNIPHGPNLIELQGWRSEAPTITLPMITALGENDIPGSKLLLGFAYIEKPEDLGGPTHYHPERDQWIFLFGAKDFTDFDADVEFYLENKFHKINYPFYAYIPAGMYHEPLRITRVGKPLIFIDARTSPDSAKPVFMDGKEHKL